MNGGSSNQSELLHELLNTFDGDKSALKNAIDEYSFEVKDAHRNIGRPGSKIAISLKSVSRSYKLGAHTQTVLSEVSTEIYEGEFVAITGPSGSGKSTLLHIIGGLDKPSSGRVEIDGQDISSFRDNELSLLRNRKIGFVFQFFYLQPFLKLGTNIEVPGMFRNEKLRKRSPRLDELLEVVGLSDHKDYLPRQLSGGQLQRAAIARALFNEPSILLADEPTGNLDNKNTEAIVNLFLHLREMYNITIVIVTHDEKIAAKADRVLTMSDGALL